jgi:CRISPR-associated exonuclease Cas4
MIITGTHFNYYLICHRKLWLFANGIHMEHTSDLVHEGKLIHENSYPQRASKYREIEMDGIKIDFYDPAGKIIHETKKSHKEHNSHLWQLKYYIYRLEKAGVDGVTGILEYPAERQTEEVLLSIPDREYIEEIEKEITIMIITDSCPPVIDASKCKKCSYNDFCYSNEPEFQ